MKHSRALLLVLALAVSLCALHAAAHVHDDGPSHPFHCRRPFASLNNMGELSKLSSETNCLTPYFNVTEAGVTVTCEHTDGITCRAAVNIGLRVADDVAARLSTQLGTPDDFLTDEARRTLWLQDVMSNMPTDATDPWRYSLTLRSQTRGTAVNYKGFDGNGFSMCCDLLTADTEADAEFPEPPLCQRLSGSLGDNDVEQDADGTATLPFRVVRHCPLPVPLSQVTAGTAERTVHGRVEKPLHVHAPGAWEAEVNLWRSRGRWVADDDHDDDKEDVAEPDTETLLRIVIPFNVSSGLWQNDMRGAPKKAPSTSQDGTAVVVGDEHDL